MIIYRQFHTPSIEFFSGLGWGLVDSQVLYSIPKAITHFSPTSYFGTNFPKILKYSDSSVVFLCCFGVTQQRNAQGLFESYT